MKSYTLKIRASQVMPLNVSYFSSTLCTSHFPYVLYNPDFNATSSNYGKPPSFDLYQWSKVLYQADRWGFVDLREASRDAVFPLASSVDKIVLSEDYGFGEWLAPAFADLLAREEDLTLEEAERLSLKTVVTIAKCRLQARQIHSVRPMETIHALVAELFSREPLQESEASEPAPTDNLDPEQQHDIQLNNLVEVKFDVEREQRASSKPFMKALVHPRSHDDERLDAASFMILEAAENKKREAAENKTRREEAEDKCRVEEKDKKKEESCSNEEELKQDEEHDSATVCSLGMTTSMDDWQSAREFLIVGCLSCHSWSDTDVFCSPSRPAQWPLSRGTQPSKRSGLLYDDKSHPRLDSSSMTSKRLTEW
jgi:hypothetical protein